MWRRKGRLFGLGRRLSFLALGIQILVPFLLAVEMRAATAAAESAAFEQSLCHHDGPAPSPGQAPQHQGCNFSCCLLCTTLLASTAFGLPTQDGVSVPFVVASAPPSLVEDNLIPPPLFSRPFRSRAPPST